MEDNITDALKMAAAVLVFVIALGVSISSFSQARQTIDTLLTYQDREYDYTYVEQNGTTQRVVGAETIIPVIYRSFKENYKIYFYEDAGKTIKMPLYTAIDAVGNSQEINCIDLQGKMISFGNDIEKEDFIMALLFGSKLDESKYGKSFHQIEENFRINKKIHLNSDGLYDKINNRRNGFIEYIGEYYQEDEITDPSQADSQSETPDANKTKKRVYTYIVK